MKYILLALLLLTSCVKKEPVPEGAVTVSQRLREILRDGVKPTEKQLDAQNLRCTNLCKPYAPAYFSPISSDCLCMAGDKE